MKIISKYEHKIVPMSTEIKDFITKKSGQEPSYDEVEFITDWKGGHIFNIKNPAFKDGYTGRPVLVLQKGNEVYEIDFNSDEAREITKKSAKENNITQDSYIVIQDYNEEDPEE